MMEWRCEWCGKPHEEDDPPCDNCGHGKFERAVVRQGSSSNSGSTVVWVCTDCGREHTKHSPPCSRCNNATLERQEKTISDADLTKRPGEATTEKLDRETTTVWACTECGREHARHTATCNNCGNAELEETQKRVDASETAIPSYLDLVTPQYALALGAVLLIAAVAILGFAGVIDVPFISNDLPEVDAPGSAEETETGVALADVEEEFVTGINEQREAENVDTLTRSSGLDDAARFRNQQRVRKEVGGEGEINEQRIKEFLSERCQGSYIGIDPAVSITDDDTAGSLSEKLLTGFFASPLYKNEQIDSIGVDTHAVDGELYLQIFACPSS
jgi:hypothetical protein